MLHLAAIWEPPDTGRQITQIAYCSLRYNSGSRKFVEIKTRNVAVASNFIELEALSLYENHFMWKCNMLLSLVLGPLGFVTNITKQSSFVVSASSHFFFFLFWLKFLRCFLQSCQSWTCQHFSSFSSVWFCKPFASETVFFKIPNLINLKSTGSWATFKSTEVGPFYLKPVKLCEVICSQNRCRIILIFTAVHTTFYTTPSLHQGLNSSAEGVFWFLCKPEMGRLLYLFIRSELTFT